MNSKSGSLSWSSDFGLGMYVGTMSAGLDVLGGTVGDDLMQDMKSPSPSPAFSTPCAQNPGRPEGMYSLFTRRVQSQDTWPRTLEAMQL